MVDLSVIELLDSVIVGDCVAAYTALPTFVAGGDVRVVLTDLPDLVLVNFPGTRPLVLADWERDFDADPESILDHPEYGRCHAGFVSGAQAILPDLLPALSRGKLFAMGGHSLGAIMAIFAAALLASHGLVAKRLTTCGAPRGSIGPGLGTAIAAIPGLRLRHGADPVPYVPLPPFQHDRTLFQFGAPGLIGLLDHEIARYRDAFAALTAQQTTEGTRL